MKSPFTIILVLLLLSHVAMAQQIKPYIFNAGGGTSVGLSTNADWSIGENIAIASFSTPQLLINTGVLQGNINVVSNINELGAHVFGAQISITPNPSFDAVKLLFQMQKPGNINVSILNSASQLLKKLDIGWVQIGQLKTVLLNDLPSGVYFFHVQFKSVQGLTQNGVYKIVRL